MPPKSGIDGWRNTNCHKPLSLSSTFMQVLLTTGAAMMVSQFVLFPPLIKRLGIARWQQIGGLVSVPAYVFVPCAKLFSWNEPSLFVASVVGTTVVNNCILAVSSSNHQNAFAMTEKAAAYPRPCALLIRASEYGHMLCGTCGLEVWLNEAVNVTSDHRRPCGT